MEESKICGKNRINLPNTNFTHELLQSIIQTTFNQVEQRQVSRKVNQKLPQKYFNYMRQMEQTAKGQSEPKHSKKHHKMLTQPSQGKSHDQRHNFDPTNRERTKQSVVTFKQTPKSFLKKIGRFQKSNKSIRVSLTVGEQDSKEGAEVNRKRVETRILTRRRILQNKELVPLNKQNEVTYSCFENETQKIDILRERKIKLQQAMKAFKSQNRYQRSENTKDKNSKPFTTDYKGNIIYMIPRILKIKKIENNLTFRIKTQIQSNFTQGKVLTTTKKGFLKQINSNIVNQMDSCY